MLLKDTLSPSQIVCSRTVTLFASPVSDMFGTYLARDPSSDEKRICISSGRDLHTWSHAST